jgi:DNA/RNA-binding domain of Phe-tRNA-synthetase-like protein
MSPAVRVSAEVLETWPGYTAAVVIAEGVTNGPSDEVSESVLVGAELTVAASGLARATDDPRIAGWRAAFSQFGAKPSRYPCSAEALLARVLKGEPLPRINALVDTYNAISLRHVIPVGGEDLDAVQGDLRLVRASGDEALRRATVPRRARVPGRSCGVTISA